MGRSLRLQTQPLYALCDLNKVEDEFYFLMSCPRYAHEQCYVLDDDSSRLTISSSSVAHQ